MCLVRCEEAPGRAVLAVVVYVCWGLHDLPLHHTRRALALGCGPALIGVGILSCLHSWVSALSS